MLILAEDSWPLRQVMQIFLENEGFDVRAVGHGGEVVDLLEGGTLPDLLICDLHMPVCDGAALVRYVRTNPDFADLPVLLLTGQVRAPDALYADVQAVLTKPFDLDDLLAQVWALVRHVAV